MRRRIRSRIAAGNKAAQRLSVRLSAAHVGDLVFACTRRQGSPSGASQRPAVARPRAVSSIFLSLQPVGPPTALA
ncbi:MAG TPA: hypothetical protein VHO25_05170, partial [Polyangiaceae bacterium]|nr:hypothetical protein [Polyangiaceae bacterium]